MDVDIFTTFLYDLIFKTETYERQENKTEQWTPGHKKGLGEVWPKIHPKPILCDPSNAMQVLLGNDKYA